MKFRLVGVLVAVAIVAVACGDSDSQSAVVSSTDQPSASQPVTEVSEVPAVTESTEAPSSDVAQAEPSAPPAEDSGLTSTVSDGWTAIAIGEGTKPSLALAPDGTPGIAFLFEDVPEGFVAYSSAGDQWNVDPLVEGYFYGPIGLAFDLDGAPNIAYHDHQASSFRQELGDLTHAVRDGSSWEITAAKSNGHDGWDSTIAIGADGVVRAAGVDPSQFGSPEGLEYYELVDGSWQIEAIGSGPIEYEWNVDLQVDPEGTPGITYFLTDAQDLIYASREGGAWTSEVVDSDGDVGRFSSFDFDADGYVHIAYWNGDTGEVWYASNSTGAWVLEPIASLSAVQIGFEGARRITSLVVDSEGTVRVAYSDVSGIWLAERDASGAWNSQQVVQAGSLPLGQLVSLKVDQAGTPHISYFEVTANSPLSGVVAYVTTAS